MPAQDKSKPEFAPIPIPLYPDESLEDLQRNGLRLIQKRDGFRFGEDALLLAHEAGRQWDHLRRGPMRFAEFGSGSGVGSILLNTLSPQSEGIGIELMPRQVEVMQRNIQLNQLDDRLQALEADIRELADDSKSLPAPLEAASFDLIMMNPPYSPLQQMSLEEDETAAYERRVAREEITINLTAICKAALRLLRHRGRLICIHRATRMLELNQAMRAAGLEPTWLQLIEATPGADPYACIVVGTKAGRPGSFKISSTLVVRDEHGRYSERLDPIYGNPQPLSAEELFAGIEIKDLS